SSCRRISTKKRNQEFGLRLFNSVAGNLNKSENMYKKNIAYARKSLKKADKESSTVVQFQAINVYAKNNDVDVHLQIHDESSGKSLFRDGIQRVMQFIK